MCLGTVYTKIIFLFIRYQYTMEKINKVGWIGIGRMGLPMVKKILEAGFKVTIWNRTRSKAEALAKYGAEIVDALWTLQQWMYFLLWFPQVLTWNRFISVKKE